MNDVKTTIDRFPAFSRIVNTEGITLLKNNNNTLPITNNDTVSLFGRSQINYYRSGTGSGGAVNVLYSINALEGLQNNDVKINQELLQIYLDFINKQPFNNGDGSWASEPWHQQELLLTENIVKNAALQSNKAIVFLGRTAGEDNDNHENEGSFKLTKEEMIMIELVTKHFDQVVLIYNVGNIIDMSYLEDHGDKIDSIVYAWQGGMEGGNALGDVLSGKVSPSGKLPDTIAKTISDYPTSKNFGSETKNYYEEDIYVGYRYFETFNRDAVLFPFGYGLSYTTFDVALNSFNYTDKNIVIDVDVKNIGNYNGKEVIQIYVESPQGKLGKPYIELKGFKKTNIIEPNELETVSIHVNVDEFASYDDSGATGFKSAYVLEAGTYNIYYGVNSRELNVAGSFTIDKTTLVEQLQEAAAPIESFKRMIPGDRLQTGEYEIAYQDVPLRTIDLEKRINNNLPKELNKNNNKDITFKDVFDQKASLQDFISTLSIDELSLIVLGEGMSHPLVAPGTAAAFGGLYPELHKLKIPAACAADGPSGLRMDTGHKATQMPIGTLLASTWNTDLIEELYTLEGEELSLNEVDTLLGPGMNIHRHPLCGRNFEYFSEDPYLTGKMATANVLGLRKGGSEGTLKHYAANDQEKARNDVDSILSERALREIHIKGFEMAVKEGKARSVMTAYNPVNGHQSASHYDLCTTILRNEWNYEGMVMTDWWARMNHNVTPDQSSRDRVPEMIRSQNDLYMVIPNFGAADSPHRKNVRKYIENGSLTLAELQRSVYNVLSFVLQAPVMNRPVKTLEILDLKSNTDESAYSTSVNFYATADAKGWLNLEESGTFLIEVAMRSKLSELAQSSCNLVLNEELISNIQSNGTNNEVVIEKVMTIDIPKGVHTLSLGFKKPGLEILSLKFTKI